MFLALTHSLIIYKNMLVLQNRYIQYNIIPVIGNIKTNTRNEKNFNLTKPNLSNQIFFVQNVILLGDGLCFNVMSM